MKAIVATLFAVFWTVAAAHCQIEVLPGLGFLRCVPAEQSAPSSGSHCGDNVCVTIESGQYATDFERVSAPAPPLTLAVSAFALAAIPLPDQEAESLLTPAEATAPRKPWQFVFRTALPPRAPSVAS